MLKEVCPICGSEKQDDALRCPACGYQFPDRTARFQPVAVEKSSDAVLELPEVMKAAHSYLHIFKRPDIDVVRPLDDAEQVIGRTPQSDIILSAMTVSRRHAAIRPCQGGFEIEDLGSFNGTWVNNVSITKRTLQSGDVVQIGDFFLTYFVE